MTSAILGIVERAPREIASHHVVSRFQKRCASWARVWCSSLIGELLWMTTRT